MTGRSGYIRVDPNPAVTSDADQLTTVTVSWQMSGCSVVEVRVGSPDGQLFARATGDGSERTGRWVAHGTRFYLQDVSSATTEPITLDSVMVVVLPQSPRHSRRSAAPAVGSINFGDLRRVTPIGTDWGFDRGLPIDRHFIEGFLDKHASDIQGSVLEFGNRRYTERFGGLRVTRSDVMNVQEGIAGTTIRADLTDCKEVPSESFDCIVCTQVLTFLYDIRAAVKELRRLLKPGGVLLVTVPGISCTFEPDFGEYWSWNLTPSSVTRLFSEAFEASNVTVESFGNLLTATAFLYGLAVDDLHPDEFAVRTKGYEVIVAARVTKTP